MVEDHSGFNLLGEITGNDKNITGVNNLEVNGYIKSQGAITIDADNKELKLGEAQDALIYYDGTNLIIDPKNVGTGYLQVDGQILATDKIMFTQTDGNEYIDSLNDGYIDYGATTTHRFNNDLEVAGNIQIQNGGTIGNASAERFQFRTSAIGVFINDGELITLDGDIKIANGATVGNMDDTEKFQFRAGGGGEIGFICNSAEAITIINNGNVGIGVTDPHSKLEVNGAISSNQTTCSASSDAFDVSGVNSVLVDAGDGAIVLGGFSGGVVGQIVHVVITDATNNVTLEHNEATGTQKFFLCDSSNEVMDDYGGWTLVCDGSNWYDASHAKHV